MVLTPIIYILSLIFKGPVNTRVIKKMNGEELAINFSSYYDFLLKSVFFITTDGVELVGLEGDGESVSDPAFISNFLIQEMTLLPGRTVQEANQQYLSKLSFLSDLAILGKFMLLGFFIRNYESESDSCEVLGVTFKNTTYPEVEKSLNSFILTGIQKTVFFVNAHCLNVAFEHPEYKKIIPSADLVLPDGMGLLMASRLKNYRMKENINGTDLFPKILELSQSKKFNLYFLGGTQEVNNNLISLVTSSYPGVNVVGGHHGHFDKKTHSKFIIEEINKLNVDILFVAFGVPMQEIWISEHKKYIKSNLILGVGGLFDFFSGKNKRSPQWLRELGLEWVYRIYQEPKRMWKRYIVGNPKFLLRVVKSSK